MKIYKITEASKYLGISIIGGLVILALLIFGAWNWFTCFNIPIAEAPARCLMNK